MRLIERCLDQINHPRPLPFPERMATVSAVQRRLLWLLAAIEGAIHQTELGLLLQRLGWQDDLGQPLASQLNRLREPLEAAGLLQLDQDRLSCTPALREPLCRECVRAGQFGEIAAVLRDEFSRMAKRPMLTEAVNQELRLLRIAFQAGDQAEVLQLVSRRARRGLDTAMDPVLEMACNAFDEIWFAALPLELRRLVLTTLLEEAALYLYDARGAWRLALAQFGNSSDVSLRGWMMEQWLLRGELRQAAELVTEPREPRDLERLAWLQFLRGENGEALESFQASLDLQRRGTRKRKLIIKGLPGIFYTLALLREDRVPQLERAREQVNLALKMTSDGYFEPIYRLLSDVIAISRGEIRTQDSIWLNRNPLALEPLFELLRALARDWLGAEPHSRQAARICDYAGKAGEGGWRWYAVEASLLLRELQVRNSALPPCASTRVPEGGDFAHITRLVREQETWERALLALSAINQPPEEDGEQEQRRMTWRLELIDDDHCVIEPKEQKRSRRGNWTRGRTVSLERLYAGGSEFDYLTAEDREICRAIQTEVSYEYYGRYPRTVYTLNPEQALLAAVGHPQLYWADEPDVQVDLVLDEPALEVRKETDHLLLRIEPHPSDGSSLMLRREGIKRLKIVQFALEHRRVADILGEHGLRVPVSARERVLDSIVSIAPLMTIHSDIGVGQAAAEQVSTDSRPHVHLKPIGDGFVVDLYVQPFAGQGPTFRPGEGRSSVFTEIEGRALHTERDLETERDLANAILEACPALLVDADWNWQLEQPEQALETLLALQDLGDQLVLEWPQGRKVRLSRSLGVGSMHLVIRKHQDWFGIDGGLRLDDERVIAMRDLLQLVEQSNGRFVRLGENEFLTLSKDLRRRIAALRDLGEDGRFHPLAIHAMQEITDGMQLDAAQAWKRQLEQLEQVRNLQPELPTTLQAELREYQLEGFRWLARLAHWGAGACLADDMGLGKTLQALSIILHRAPLGPSLVLAPTSVCGNWLEEADRFAPTLKVQRFGIGDRERMVSDAGPFDLIVCSYGLLQTQSERLAEIEWATIVADEAQAIKNTATKRSRAAMSLKAGFRMITTGTPIENHLGELWNLFRFINPGLLGSLDLFNERFASPIENGHDLGARQRLKQLIRPFILRRLKSDVLTELPERTEVTLHVELSEDEMLFYNALRAQAVERIRGAARVPAGQQRMRILAEITRLRQACCNPRLVMPDSRLPSAKLEAFGEILEELRENRHKALVFSQFVGHLALIREYLDGLGVHYQYLDGSTPVRQRSEAIHAFQRGEGDLFLISLKAGGSGLNLTAADYVIHMDPWWNPAVEDQASDRAHRIGQLRPVTVYRLVAQGTIEDQIVRLHAHKRDLADNLLEGSDMSGRMSVDEMLDLLKAGGLGV